MNKVLPVIFLVFLSLNAQALFEVKDASDHSVFEITNDGIRIFNYPDTLMIISESEIRANLDNSTKGLSRSFSLSTSATGKGALTNVLEVTTDNTIMREGVDGDQYTNFSPDNISLGLNSGINNTPNSPILNDGTANVFVGNNAGYLNSRGQKNIFMGDSAGFSNTGGDRNIFIGTSAGKLNYGGYQNIFIGTEAGSAIVGADQNICIGDAAGKNTTTDGNIFIGASAGVGNTTGSSNMSIGNNAGAGTIDCSASVYLGDGAGETINGWKNTFVGVSSGYGSYTGDYNTYIGQWAGNNNDGGSNNVCLGRAVTVSGSNKLAIHNTGTEPPLIYGEFDNNLLRVNGNLDVTGSTTVAGNTSLGGSLITSGNAIFNSSVGIGKTPAFMLDILSDYVGIYSRATTSTRTAVYGVFGTADGGSTTNYGVYGTTSGSTGTHWAGYFNGDVNITGITYKSVSKTKIDHPLDPKNKFLVHSSIESDKMMNVYNGNIILDSEGKAIVTLPEWMEALNTEFRYQLTAIGGAAPSLHIAKEVSNSTFEIAGGKPNMKISWEITGIRNDNYAKSNPIEVEIDKDSIEKGYYLHPEAYGQPKEMGIDHQHEKAMKEQSSN